MTENEEQRPNKLENQQQTQNDSAIEYSKLPGFDVLEQLPEELNTIQHQNEDNSSSISHEKFLSVTVPQENKLMYHFEHNDNASITSNIGEMYKVFTDLRTATNDIDVIIKEVDDYLQTLIEPIEKCDVGIYEEIKPEIGKMEIRLRKFLIEQKTENFKLVKDVASLEKERKELFDKLSESMLRVERMEKALRQHSKDKDSSFITQTKFNFKGRSNNNNNSGDNNNNLGQTSRTTRSIAHTYNSDNPKAYCTDVSLR
jgi:hypothetical protein